MFSYRNKIIFLFYSVILFTGFSLTAGNMSGNSKYKTVEMKNHADYCQVYYSEKDLNATLDGEKIELNGILTLDKGKFQFVLTDPSGKTVYSKNYDTPGKYNFKKTFKNIKGKWQMKAHCFDSKFEYKISLKQKLFVSGKLTFPYKDEYRKYGDFIALADRRVFAVMAFVNACGYDEFSDAKYKEMLPLRIKIRKEVEQNLKKHPEKWTKFKAFYKLHPGCSKYIYYALSLNLKYPFKRIEAVSEMENPWVINQLLGFDNIINEFWEVAELGKVWESVKKDYIDYNKTFKLKKMQKQRKFVWKYLRMPQTDNYTFICEVNPLMPRLNMTGEKSQNYLYSVGGENSISDEFEFFSYLGDFLDQYNFEKYYSKYKDILMVYYLQAIRINPDINLYFDVEHFTRNCLLRGLNFRVSEAYYKEYEPEKYKEYLPKFRKSLKWTSDEIGYNLTKVFYDNLGKFEKRKVSFEDYIPSLFKNIPVLSKKGIEKILKQKNLPPVVIKTSPVCGSQNVDPEKLKTIKVYYSKNLSHYGFSLSTGSAEYPEIVADPGTKENCFSVPVKLDYDKVYTIWFNSKSAKNITDTFGNSAVPYLLYFKTKKKE